MTASSIHEKGFRQLLDAIGVAMLVIDERSNVVALNPEAERLFGWSEAEMLDQPLNRVIPRRYQKMIEWHLKTGGEPPHVPPEAVKVSLFAQRRDGTEFPVEFSRSLLGSGGDALNLATIRDLTKRRRAQENLFRKKEQAFVTLSSIADAIITTDLTGTVTYLNPMAERLTGWRISEAMGQPVNTILSLISEATRQSIESIPPRVLREDRTLDLADGVLLLRRDGTEVAIGDSAAPIRDRNGITKGVVIVFHDVTERRRVVRALSHEATHDSITGLINRQGFERRLARLLAEVAADGKEHALCYMDLDRFKLVNDVCGHEAGDTLLRMVGELLNDRLRSHDTIGRLGGDEFGILLEHCSLSKAEEIANSIQKSIEEFKYVWEGRDFTLGASIGVVPITASSGRVADAMRAVDNACYEAKEAGGNRVHLGPAVAPGVHPDVETRQIARLTRAVDEGRFQLYAQPIVPLAEQSPARPWCEILLRLPNKRGGVEAPASFLPQAERYQLLPAIDRWVIRQTVALLAEWRRKNQERELPLCSINLSVSSVHDPELIPTVRERLAEHRLPADTLGFEVNEAAALENVAQLVRFIAEARSINCEVGLDDFGNGLTSFAHLKALPVDYIKIGGHYVRGSVEDPVYGTVVSAVNQIGRIMGIATIAEEVENETILQTLQGIGVGYAQGHAVGPPVPLMDTEGNVNPHFGAIA